MKKVLIALLVVLSLSACSNSSVDFEGVAGEVYMNEKTGEDTNFGYDQLPEKNNLVETRLADVKEYIRNKENFILYIGRNTCPYCQELVPMVDEAAKNMGITVNYFNYVKERELLGEMNSNAVDNFFNDLGLEYVPIVYIYREGKIVDSFSLENVKDVNAIVQKLKQVK